MKKKGFTPTPTYCNKRKLKLVRGFTLLEVAIALAVLFIIAVGSFEFFRYCKHFILDTEARFKAVNLARDTMEKYYYNFDMSPSSGDEPLPNPSPEGNFGIIGGTRNYSITDNGKYYTVTVTVNW